MSNQPQTMFLCILYSIINYSLDNSVLSDIRSTKLLLKTSRLRRCLVQNKHRLQANKKRNAYNSAALNTMIEAARYSPKVAALTLNKMTPTATGHVRLLHSMKKIKKDVKGKKKR